MPGVRLRLAGEVQQLQVCSGGEQGLKFTTSHTQSNPGAFVVSQSTLFFRRTQPFIHWWYSLPNSRTWASGFYSEPFC